MRNAWHSITVQYIHACMQSGRPVNISNEGTSYILHRRRRRHYVPRTDSHVTSSNSLPRNEYQCRIMIIERLVFVCTDVWLLCCRMICHKSDCIQRAVVYANRSSNNVRLMSTRMPI